MTPNKENIRKWVDELRSGKYEQTRSRLYDGKGYCCLGVACAVAGLTPNFISAQGGYEFDGAVGTLPRSVQQWLGIDRDNPRLNIGDSHIMESSAVSMNDVYEQTFSQIADAIENTYLGDK